MEEKRRGGEGGRGRGGGGRGGRRNRRRRKGRLRRRSLEFTNESLFFKAGSCVHRPPSFTSLAHFSSPKKINRG